MGRRSYDISVAVGVLVLAGLAVLIDATGIFVAPMAAVNVTAPGFCQSEYLELLRMSLAGCREARTTGLRALSLD